MRMIKGVIGTIRRVFLRLEWILRSFVESMRSFMQAMAWCMFLAVVSLLRR